MTNPLSIALIGDGTSDRALAKVIVWAIRRLRPDATLRDVGFIARRGRGLVETVHRAASTLQPDLLFVHRDAERVPLVERRAEIPEKTGVVKIVPVRMTEAWLGQLVQSVAAQIRDFSTLDHLEAYRAFESDLRVALKIV